MQGLPIGGGYFGQYGLVTTPAIGPDGVYRLLSGTYRVDAVPGRPEETYRRGRSLRRATYRAPTTAGRSNELYRRGPSARRATYRRIT